MWEGVEGGRSEGIKVNFAYMHSAGMRKMTWTEACRFIADIAYTTTLGEGNIVVVISAEFLHRDVRSDHWQSWQRTGR